MKIYLVYQDEKSHKFWQIEVKGKEHTVTYGKVGTDGQSKTKEFASNEQAIKDAEKLAASKKKKGYTAQEIGHEQKEALQKLSEYYGLPLRGLIAGLPIDEEHTTLGASNIFIRHIKDDQYFGGIEKTLAGFLILTNAEDDYYLYDAREPDGKGQIWFQDHGESAALTLACDTQEQYTEGYYKCENGEEYEGEELTHYDLIQMLCSTYKPKRKKSRLAVSSKELFDRYFWVRQFLKGNYPETPYGDYWINPKDVADKFKNESVFLKNDPHLSIYWLFHFTIMEEDNKIAEIITTIKETPVKLLQDAIEVFSDRKLFYSLFPNHHSKAELFQSCFNAIKNEDPENAWKYLAKSITISKTITLTEAGLLARYIDTKTEEIGQLINEIAPKKEAQTYLQSLLSKSKKEQKEEVAKIIRQQDAPEKEVAVPKVDLATIDMVEYIPPVPESDLMLTDYIELLKKNVKTMCHNIEVLKIFDEYVQKIGLYELIGLEYFEIGTSDPKELEAYLEKSQIDSMTGILRLWKYYGCVKWKLEGNECALLSPSEIRSIRPEKEQQMLKHYVDERGQWRNDQLKDSKTMDVLWTTTSPKCYGLIYPVPKPNSVRWWVLCPEGENQFHAGSDPYWYCIEKFYINKVFDKFPILKALKYNQLFNPDQVHKYFECKTGKSGKFWEVFYDDKNNAMLTSYGEIGGKGDEKISSFSTTEELMKAVNKAISDKTKKGYAEIEAGSLES